jgi:cation transport ATPase
MIHFHPKKDFIMSKISIFFGLLLSAIGILAWVIDGMSKEAVTALIPVFLGLPIALCGKLAAKNPEKTKLYMHIAVTLALILVIGAGMRIPKLEGFNDVKSISIWATTVVSLVLVGLYVQSFIKARTAKEIAEPSGDA